MCTESVAKNANHTFLVRQCHVESYFMESEDRFTQSCDSLLEGNSAEFNRTVRIDKKLVE